MQFTIRWSLCAALALVGCDGSGDEPGADLNGTWETACYQRTRTSLTYADLAFTGTYTEYADDACTSAYHVSTWTGTATVGAALTSGAQKLDLSFETFTSEALTAENADFNNMNAYCGFTDWQANVEKDVLGAPCFGFAIPAGAKSLDIYLIDGDALKFGQGAKIAAGLTEADRPTVIDETRVFARADG